MNTKKLLCVASVVIAALIGFMLGTPTSQSHSNLAINEIDALSACESIGWWDNDGNCVKNSNTGEYFCKDDSWDEITDCIKPI